MTLEFQRSPHKELSFQSAEIYRSPPRVKQMDCKDENAHPVTNNQDNSAGPRASIKRPAMFSMRPDAIPPQPSPERLTLADKPRQNSGSTRNILGFVNTSTESRRSVSPYARQRPSRDSASASDASTPPAAAGASNGISNKSDVSDATAWAFKPAVMQQQQQQQQQHSAPVKKGALYTVRIPLMTLKCRAVAVSSAIGVGPFSGQPINKHLEAGDELHTINGIAVYKRPRATVESMLWGERGSHITLGFVRNKDKPRLIKVKLTRDQPVDTDTHSITPAATSGSSTAAVAVVPSAPAVVPSNIDNKSNMTNNTNHGMPRVIAPKMIQQMVAVTAPQTQSQTPVKTKNVVAVPTAPMMEIASAATTSPRRPVVSSPPRAASRGRGKICGMGSVSCRDVMQGRTHANVDNGLLYDAVNSLRDIRQPVNNKSSVSSLSPSISSMPSPPMANADGKRMFGVGIVMTRASLEAPLVIRKIISGSVAESHDVVVGDAVIDINGFPITRKTNIASAHQALSGTAGSTLRLTLRRNGCQSHTVTLLRGPPQGSPVSLSMSQDAARDGPLPPSQSHRAPVYDYEPSVDRDRDVGEMGGGHSTLAQTVDAANMIHHRLLQQQQQRHVPQRRKASPPVPMTFSDDGSNNSRAPHAQGDSWNTAQQRHVQPVSTSATFDSVGNVKGSARSGKWRVRISPSSNNDRRPQRSQPNVESVSEDSMLSNEATPDAQTSASSSSAAPCFGSISPPILPGSRFMTRDVTNDDNHSNDTPPSTFGLFVKAVSDTGMIQVASITVGGRAHSSGLICEGDLIYRIDGEAALPLGIHAVRNKLANASYTKLELFRPRSQTHLTVSLGERSDGSATARSISDHRSHDEVNATNVPRKGMGNAMAMLPAQAPPLGRLIEGDCKDMCDDLAPLPSMPTGGSMVCC